MSKISLAELGLASSSNMSFDLGNAYSNVVADGNVNSDYRSIMGQVSNSSQLRKLPSESSIQIDGVWYVFGEATLTFAESNAEDFTTKDRYTSAWYKRLFSFAVYKAYENRVEEMSNNHIFYPRIISSIPASEFKNPGRVAQIKKHLLGDYSIGIVDEFTLKVVVTDKNLIVIPEGAGSYYSMLSSDPSSNKYSVGIWAIVDFGYLTGDVIVFNSGEYIADRSMSSDDIGVKHIAEVVQDYVYPITGLDLDTIAYDVDLTCSEIRGVDITKIKQATLSEMGTRINKFIARATHGLNVSGVILSGGGTELYMPYIKLPFAIAITPNPRRANVEGAYIMLKDN